MKTGYGNSGFSGSSSSSSTTTSTSSYGGGGGGMGLGISSLAQQNSFLNNPQKPIRDFKVCVVYCVFIKYIINNIMINSINNINTCKRYHQKGFIR